MAGTTTRDFPASLLPHLTAPERAELRAILARRTPAAFAIEASRGRWVMPRHLALLNEKLLAVASGTIRRLMIMLPPRHGKSELTSKYFPAWYLGTFPDRRVVLASYEADFAMTWGRKVRDILNEVGGELFGVRVRRDSTAANRWGIEDDIGGMDTAGVGGPLTGKGAHLLIIDDPVKNAEEANSQTYRDKTWEWYASTAYTRLEPGGSVVLIQTRWHEDDLAGRILAAAPDPANPWHVLDLPALAEPGDALGRSPGEPLWPERYDADALEAIRRTVGSHWFSALYQQRPQPREGGFFKRAWLPVVEAGPGEADRVRWWDQAATDSGGDWTVGLLMARTPDGTFVVEDVVRGQWSPGARDREILRTADADRRAYHGRVLTWSEQEPGSSGVTAADAFVRLLEGHPARTERTSGDKQVNAGPFAAAAEAGHVRVVRAAWTAAFVDELCDFPTGRHDDQVDAAGRAFGKLARGGAWTGGSLSDY